MVTVCGRADNWAMQRLRRTWPHGILVVYTLAILCTLLVVGGPKF